jgi:hypothetical protein
LCDFVATTEAAGACAAEAKAVPDGCWFWAVGRALTTSAPVTAIVGTATPAASAH